MMHFVGTIATATGITVDGYSDRKTELGAIRDFGRYIKKYVDAGEGDCIIRYGKECLTPVDAAWRDGAYFFEMEEVGCASRMDDETGEVEYADGHWYLVAHFCK